MAEELCRYCRHPLPDKHREGCPAAIGTEEAVARWKSGYCHCEHYEDDRLPEGGDWNRYGSTYCLGWLAYLAFIDECIESAIQSRNNYGC